VDRKIAAAFGSGLTIAAVAIYAFRRRGKVGWGPLPPVTPVGEMQRIIVAEAERQGVEPRVALLFADLESGLDPMTTGDTDWPYRESGGKTNYERYVLENSKYNGSPFREDPSVWISYGLFQLLSPHYLFLYDKGAHPSELLIPEVNAKIGVGVIRNKISKYGQDLVKVRLAYGGSCLIPGRCSYSTVERIVSRLAARASRWGLDAGLDPVGYGWRIAQGLA
jgi:hypothetical protein